MLKTIPSKRLYTWQPHANNEPMARLHEQYCMHPLTQDERVTCESMLALEPSSKVLVMPTHHINELGDMMGFRQALSFCLGISAR